MAPDRFWTSSGARLCRQKKDHNSKLNWIFMPGGLGLGSESLLALIDELADLPGSMWRLDLPGDGNNLWHERKLKIEFAFAALEEAITTFENPILVAHSTGGMYALFLPSLKQLLKGLVLIGSAPDRSWRTNFAEYVQNNPIPGMGDLESAFTLNPSNETLKDITIASAPYIFTDSGIPVGTYLLEKLPYNLAACEWSDNNFDASYEAKWYPDNIPTLILSGAKDKITPISLFLKNKNFQSQNIMVREVPNAGHYPWIENGEGVKKLFIEFSKML